MTMNVTGNVIFISLDPGESNRITLPEGYTYSELTIYGGKNTWGVNKADSPTYPCIQKYPVVNSTSPNYLTINISDPSKTASISLAITAFGQAPNTQYFDTAFKPILVTGNDGNKYKVIPSDQFK